VGSSLSIAHVACRRVKNLNPTFQKPLWACPGPLSGLPSALLSSILAVHVASNDGGGESEGLEETAGVYHGLSGPRTPVAERVPSHGKSSPARSDKGAYTPERWRAHNLGRDRQEAAQVLLPQGGMMVFRPFV
jgi:hypothetical protein